MPSTSFIDLSQALSRKNRFDILRKLSMKSCRNTELSEGLDIRKERVSEALADLVSSRLVIMFEREAIIGEKKNCEITCNPLIKNVIKRFGELDEFESAIQDRCTFNIKFWRK